VLSGRLSRDVFGDAYAYPVVDDYDFAASDQTVVNTDFDRVVDGLIELDHGASTHL
jgi:hypothetical protein